MAVNTGQVERRSLRLATLADLTAEVNRVVRAAESGGLRTTGNWAAGQILQHVGKLMRFSLDGFPFAVPWPTRLLCRVLKWVSWPYLIRLAFRPGREIPAGAAALRPDDEVTVADAAAFLLGQVARIQGGERLTRPSPWEGPISHEQWVEAHLRHAKLHLSFIQFR